ncbi:MAG: hypothetical protein GX493_11425, partial [Firmicutes bacterium]|nr:hypothetical protein [Bacillota bacterium]
MKIKFFARRSWLRQVFFLFPVFLFGLVTVAGGAETSPTGEKLDLATAVRLALDADPQVIKAEAALIQAESAVAAELAKLAPGLTLKAVTQNSYTEDDLHVRSNQLSFVIAGTYPGIFPLTIGAKAASDLEAALWDRVDAEAALAQI